MTTPGARAFENMPDDLAMVGVQFAPEQLALLEHGSVFRPSYFQRLWVLTITALPDPVFGHSEALGLHALTVAEDGTQDPVLVPAVAEIDCSEWETFDETEPFWRRFPSLLGRPHVMSAATGEWMLDALQPIRLWNCWPLASYGQGDLDVALVQEAVQQWREQEWGPYLKWLEMRDNADTEYCDYEGTPEHLHDHGPDADGRHRMCQAGDAWFQQYERLRMNINEDGDPYPLPFAPVSGLYHLGPIWDHLLASSRANTHAALAAYPEWDLPEIVPTERHYSPWLWSC